MNNTTKDFYDEMTELQQIHNSFDEREVGEGTIINNKVAKKILKIRNIQRATSIDELKNILVNDIINELPNWALSSIEP